MTARTLEVLRREQAVVTLAFEREMRRINSLAGPECLDALGYDRYLFSLLTQMR